MNARLYSGPMAALVSISLLMILPACAQGTQAQLLDPNQSIAEVQPQKPQPAHQRQPRLRGSDADASRRPDTGASNQKSFADRMERGEAGQQGKGVIRFGDTEVRVGGRVSVGYGFSGR